MHAVATRTPRVSANCAIALKRIITGSSHCSSHKKKTERSRQKIQRYDGALRSGSPLHHAAGSRRGQGRDRERPFARSGVEQRAFHDRRIRNRHKLGNNVHGIFSFLLQIFFFARRLGQRAPHEQQRPRRQRPSPLRHRKHRHANAAPEREVSLAQLQGRREPGQRRRPRRRRPPGRRV